MNCIFLDGGVGVNINYIDCWGVLNNISMHLVVIVIKIVVNLSNLAR